MEDYHLFILMSWGTWLIGYIKKDSILFLISLILSIVGIIFLLMDSRLDRLKVKIEKKKFFLIADLLNSILKNQNKGGKRK